jgi:hypothetical protein
MLCVSLRHDTLFHRDIALKPLAFSLRTDILSRRVSPVHGDKRYPIPVYRRTFAFVPPREHIVSCVRSTCTQLARCPNRSSHAPVPLRPEPRPRRRNQLDRGRGACPGRRRDAARSASHDTPPRPPGHARSMIQWAPPAYKSDGTARRVPRGNYPLFLALALAHSRVTTTPPSRLFYKRLRRSRVAGRSSSDFRARSVSAGDQQTEAQSS